MVRGRVEEAVREAGEQFLFRHGRGGGLSHGRVARVFQVGGCVAAEAENVGDGEKGTGTVAVLEHNVNLGDGAKREREGGEEGGDGWTKGAGGASPQTHLFFFLSRRYCRVTSRWK